MEPRGLLLRTQEPANYSYPKPELSSPRPGLILFFKVPFNIIHPATPSSSKCSL
jgi:hypothetical protein